MRYTGNVNVSLEEQPITTLSGDGVELLRMFQVKIWVFNKDILESQQNAIQELLAGNYIYIPKVLDLEEPTPDYGITDKGKEFKTESSKLLSPDIFQSMMEAQGYNGE